MVDQATDSIARRLASKSREYGIYWCNINIISNEIEVHVIDFLPL